MAWQKETSEQKRIVFQSMHRDLMGNLKPGTSIDTKTHDDLCKYVVKVVEWLWTQFPDEEFKKVMDNVDRYIESKKSPF